MEAVAERPKFAQKLPHKVKLVWAEPGNSSGIYSHGAGFEPGVKTYWGDPNGLGV